LRQTATLSNGIGYVIYLGADPVLYEDGNQVDAFDLCTVPAREAGAFLRRLANERAQRRVAGAVLTWETHP